MHTEYYIKIITAIIFMTGTLMAQMEANVNLNIATQPIWGPTGYDQADNYFIPDIEVYYNVSQQVFYTNEEGNWTSSLSLPSRFGKYDLYKAHKVVMNDKSPWLNNDVNRERYYTLIKVHDQKPIRDSRDSKYFVNANHPEHKNWLEKQKHKNIKEAAKRGQSGIQ